MLRDEYRVPERAGATRSDPLAREFDASEEADALERELDLLCRGANPPAAS